MPQMAVTTRDEPPTNCFEENHDEYFTPFCPVDGALDRDIAWNLRAQSLRTGAAACARPACSGRPDWYAIPGAPGRRTEHRESPEEQALQGTHLGAARSRERNHHPHRHGNP